MRAAFLTWLFFIVFAVLDQAFLAQTPDYFRVFDMAYWQGAFMLTLLIAGVFRRNT